MTVVGVRLIIKKIKGDLIVKLVSNKAIEWYTFNKTKYELLCKELELIIEKKLKSEFISFSSITSRAKEIESYSKKCNKNKYSDPQKEIMDLAGIRIITYTNSDVIEICSIIESIFDIDYENSSNKLDNIDVDRFGYLSVHYIAKLKDEYFKTVIYEEFEGMQFEIQIRTILQHAWAEIEHDRSYKFNGVLPKKLKRKFFMLAGVLELVDNEFEYLTKEIDSYAKEVTKKAQLGLLDFDLDSTSLHQYWTTKFNVDMFLFQTDENIFRELKNYGISTLEELDKLITKIDTDELISYSLENNEDDENVSIIGFLRDLMIITDARKYFEHWNNNWGVSDLDVAYFKGLDVDIEVILDELKIVIEIEDDDEDEDEEIV